MTKKKKFLATGEIEEDCGGVLISKRHVLTSAQCVFHRWRKIWFLSSVRLGYDDTKTEIDCLSGDCTSKAVSIKIQAQLVHEKYDPGKREYDLVVLKLTNSVPNNQYIQPACLPSAESSTLQREYNTSENM